ncbi:MAG: flagellar export chaperone FliS [Solirubrobacteraceae bacterium]
MSHPATLAYRESSVLTASPEQLVVMLYDGARRFLLQAGQAMQDGDYAAGNRRLQRAEAIIDELLATLDLSTGAVAEQLQAIYLFCRRQTMEARVERDPKRLEQVSELLGELRDAWHQIATSAAA